MISNLIRVIQIIYCVIKNDIDTMLLNSNLVGNKKFIFYIFPWNWFNKTEVMDGPQKIRKLFSI